MGLRGEEREGQRVRITDLNKAGHFCVASSEIVWVLSRGEEVEGGKGEGRLFGRVAGGEVTGQRGGVLCRLRPRAVFSGGRLLQLQHYYKAGLLGFMNKARK